MKTKILAIGAAGLAAALTGGWALAQAVGTSSGFGPASMPGRHAEGAGPGMKAARHGMGPGTMMGMEHGTGHRPGTMKRMGGHGPGMMNEGQR
jgi:hypothetical protein